VVLALAEGGEVLVESKWGDPGLYVHRAELRGYGRHLFYRSARTGHHVRELPGEQTPGTELQDGATAARP
jgi:hypothetical protein